MRSNLRLDKEIEFEAGMCARAHTHTHTHTHTHARARARRERKKERERIKTKLARACRAVVFRSHPVTVGGDITS